MSLLTGEIDLAVHSMKNMPAEMPEMLEIGAVYKREDPRDVLVTFDGTDDVENLKRNATVGTSSLRRELQLLNIRPDLIVKPIRGNVLQKMLQAG